MKFINCPLCGHKLLEGKAGSIVQVKCNKCSKILKVEISEQSINILALKTKEQTNGEPV